jgi:hypothetical protein
MKRAWIAVLAGCATPGSGPVIGTGQVTLNNDEVAMSAWMEAAAVFDDTMPDAPTVYFGWNVVFSQDPPGTSCKRVKYPSWTAQVTVASASRGSTPEDAPITPGTFTVASPAAPPDASVMQEAGVASQGSVIVSEFDDTHITGTFSASGETNVIPPQLFRIDGSFDATRCDF